MNSGCKILLVNSLTDFKNISDPWNNLLASSSSNSVFLTWEWLYTWAEYYLGEKKQLFITTIYKDNELIGIAPWYINNIRFGPFKLKRIEFLGAPETGSDYLDVITKKGKEKEVALVIYDFLFKDALHLWDIFLFKDIPANSLFFLHFLNIFEEAGKYIEVQQGSFSPVLLLPKTKEDFFSSLSLNRRQNFKKELRMLNQQYSLKHVNYFSNDIENAFDHFYSLYQAKWNKTEPIFFVFLKKFISITKEKGLVKLDILSLNDKNRAGILHLNYAGTDYAYLSAIDKTFEKKISIGNIIIGLCIQDAIERKKSEYDLLKGHESYKFHWTNSGKRSLNIYYYQKKPGSIFLFSCQFLKKLGKIFLR